MMTNTCSLCDHGPNQFLSISSAMACELYVVTFLTKTHIYIKVVYGKACD